MKLTIYLIKLFLISSILLIFASKLLLAVPTPEILWHFDTDDSAFGMTATGDIDGDGKLELVFGCYRNDDHIYALNAEDGSLLWKYNATLNAPDGCNDVAPILFDIDGDGVLEIIVPSSCNPIVTCFNGKDGSVIWQSKTKGSDSPPTIADIDNDGQQEIIFGEFGGSVICFDILTGNMEWEILVDKNSWIQTAPSIADFDMDGNLDFVVATWNNVDGDTNRVYAYRAYDQSLLWSYDIKQYVYHGTSIVNLDDDEYPELVLGDYSGTLYAVNADNGSVLWTKQYHPDFYIGSPVSIGDVDGDGQCDILFSSYLYIMCLNKNGDIKWEYPIEGYPSAFRGVILSDIDNDYLPDVIFGTSDGKIMSLKGTDGSKLLSLDFSETFHPDFDINHAPVLADFDGDNLPEIFFIGGKTDYPDVSKNFGRGYCLSLKSGTGPDWLMFQNNIRRTGNSCDKTTGTDYSNLLNEIIISPNPATDYITINMNAINPMLQSGVGDELFAEIYDVMGVKIRSTQSASQPPLDEKSFKIDIYNLSHGVYFLKIMCSNGTLAIVEKFVKI